jgi:hypothetical protein
MTSYLGGLYRIVVEGLGTYYGESDQIPRRWRHHRKLLANHRHHCLKLRRAWIALGAGAFRFEVIEQSRELTESKALRLMRERLLILSDPLNLNTAGSGVAGVTETSLPPKDAYRGRVVRLVRKGRSGVVEVRECSGLLLGIELMDGKFRVGTFRSDADCVLTRLKGAERC